MLARPRANVIEADQYQAIVQLRSNVPTSEAFQTLESLVGDDSTSVTGSPRRPRCIASSEPMTARRRSIQRIDGTGRHFRATVHRGNAVASMPWVATASTPLLRATAVS